MADSTIHVSGHVPPRHARLARMLWFRAVRSRELLERAQAFEHVDAALCSDDLELALTAFAASVAPLSWAPPGCMLLVARTAADLVEQLARELGATSTWLEEDREAFGYCLGLATAPDVDAHQLAAARALAIERAGKPGRGEHRYRLMTAASLVASLGMQRERRAVSAVADAAILAELLVGVARDACASADLFARRPSGYLEWACSLVRDRAGVVRAGGTEDGGDE